jgi:asparagine synthase (glutamine-hydrolysing)
MCGIAGIAGRGAGDAAALERMAAAMFHRGPDGHGVWHDDRVGLSFRRLAIIDLDERSNQPFHRDDVHLVFNGEIYNYIELREELRRCGHTFVTEGDAEVLLHAWLRWGEACLHSLNGMFAFALWDARTRRLSLVTDRFAEKPLYFHHVNDRLLFASEVRAMGAADPSVGVPDPRATASFLALEEMPVLPATFFRDVQRLPPAHIAHWTPDGSVRVSQWWEPKTIDVPREPQDAARELRDRLISSISLRLRSDVPVGTSLSGGIDSSAVVALTSQLVDNHRRHAFTATFPGFARDEWKYADAVASLAEVGHHHAVNPRIDELFDDLPALVASQEEPFRSTSIYAQWRVMRAAREAGVIVLLDGQGADELLAGYDGVEGWALRALGHRAALSAVLRDRRVAESVLLAYSSGRAPELIARRHRLRRASPYVAPELAREAAAHPDAPCEWTTSGSPLRRQLLTQLFCTSLPNLCRFADHNSMAFGVEVRLPFLDPHIAEFALSLPTPLVWRDGVTKPVLRDAIAGDVPDIIVARRDKVGYETPQDRWFSSELGRARIAEMLLDDSAVVPCVRAEIERDLATAAWRDTAAIWRLINVELWLSAPPAPEPISR